MPDRTRLGSCCAFTSQPCLGSDCSPFSAGAEAEIADEINALGPNLVLVFPGSKRGFAESSRQPIRLSYDDIGAIAENVTGINGVAAGQATTRNVVGTKTVGDVSIVGTTAGFAQVRDYQVELGRFLDDQDNDRANKVAVLGNDIAAELLGDRSAALGDRIRIGATQFTIVGVMGKKGVVGSTDYDRRVYIPFLRHSRTFAYGRLGKDTVGLI